MATGTVWDRHRGGGGDGLKKKKKKKVGKKIKEGSTTSLLLSCSQFPSYLFAPSFLKREI